MIGAFAITDISFWLYLIYFFVAVFISNYIPGNLFVQNLKIDRFSKIVLSLVLGIALWGYQGYIFGYLGFRDGTYIYLGACVVIWLMQRHPFAFKLPKVKLSKESFVLPSILFIGTIVQLLTIWFSGVFISQGLYFCCGIDSVYHLAITNELVKQFPPLEPGTHNTVVTNYHYFSNMIVAEWVRVFHLPLTATFFQYATILFSALIGASAITFGRIVGFNKTTIYWLLFFLYFSGSAMYLLVLFFQHRIDLSSIVLHDATLLWASPPRVYGIVLFLSGLSLLHLWLTQRKASLGLLSAVLFGCLISIKVYFGIFVLAGFCLLNLYFLWKKDIRALFPSIVTLFLSLCLYLPVNQDSGGLFFSGLWRFQNFIISPPLVLANWEAARQVYVEHNNWLRLIQYEFSYILLYFIATFGTLLLFLFQTPTSLRSLRKELHIFLIGGIVVSIVAGSVFLQSTGGANTSQFIITVLAIISVYAALAAAFWTSKIKNKFIGLLLLSTIVLLTIPRAAYDTYMNISRVSSAQGFTISNNELEAIRALKQSHDGIILTPMIDCLYLRFLTDKPLYVCDDASVITDHEVLHGKEKIQRSKDMHKVLESFTPSDFLIQEKTNVASKEAALKKLLKKEQINYIYIKKEKNSNSTLLQRVLPVLFQNESILILKVP